MSFSPITSILGSVTCNSHVALASVGNSGSSSGHPGIAMLQPPGDHCDRLSHDIKFMFFVNHAVKVQGVHPKDLIRSTALYQKIAQNCSLARSMIAFCWSVIRESKAQNGTIGLANKPITRDYSGNWSILRPSQSLVRTLPLCFSRPCRRRIPSNLGVFSRRPWPCQPKGPNPC